MAPAQTPPTPGNAPEFTVTELSGALKRTVEDAFGRVRVRGEISGYRGPHASGHMYFCLKDAGAKIDAVIWKTGRAALAVRPEEGMEVIATGKLTTYPGKSTYQIVVDRLEPAGVGALLAQLERRKTMLAAEGLFDPTRKRALPFLPGTIGVITSPTGAVIRDILHRLADRFPRRVLVWPVAVQGEGAAAQVAAAIAGFNAAPPALRPDLLIVARGGGSIEDLWAFNEEAVVRAIAASAIPTIAAIGHETDSCLADLAADRRAPTPTAAAEMAVPVRADLIVQVASLDARQGRCATRHLDRATERVTAARLPSDRALLAMGTQRLDDLGARLPSSRALLAGLATRLASSAARLPRPALLTERASERVLALAGRLPVALQASARASRLELGQVARGLTPVLVTRRHAAATRDLAEAVTCLATATAHRIAAAERAKGRAADPLRPALVSARERAAAARLHAATRLLRSLSHVATLQRGYAIVERVGGGVLATAKAARVTTERAVTLRFADGEVAADLGVPASRRARTATPTLSQDRLI